MSRVPETLFPYLIFVQFALVVFHDWLEIPGWTHGRQVQTVVGRQKLLWATLINAIFPGVAVAFAIWFRGQSQPNFVRSYWAIYCAVTVLSAIAMWYVPYLFGAEKQKVEGYTRMYEGTLQILPQRGENPRPNLFHVSLHVLFIVNLGLALSLRFHHA